MLEDTRQLVIEGALARKAAVTRRFSRYLLAGLDPLKTEPRLLRQTKVLNGLMLTALVLCVPLGAFWAVLATPLFIPVYAFSFFAWVGLIACLRSTGQVTLVGRCAVSVLFSLCTASVVLLGSRDTNILAWYMLMPLAAAVCVGRSDLWFWGVVATVTPMVLYLFPDIVPASSSDLSFETKRQLSGIVLALGGLIASILTSIWISHHEQLAQRLDDSVARLSKETEAQRLLVQTAILGSGEVELGSGARRLLSHLVKLDWVSSVAFWDTRTNTLPSRPYCSIPNSILFPPSKLARRVLKTGEHSFATDLETNRRSVCYPIRDGKDVVGIIEFNALDTRSPASEEGWLLQQISIQLGHIAERERTAAIIQKEARYDALTNLPNRRAFLSILEGELKAAEQASTRVALLFIDLNDFKRINDSLGHAAGDEVLRVVASRLQQVVRGSDSNRDGQDYVSDRMSRVGGDEFTLVLDSMPAADAAEAAAQRILDVLGSPIRLRGEQFKVGASIGIALYPEDAQQADSLIRAADSAMYAAKRRGGLGYVRYQASDESVDSLRFETDLRRALESNELEMHYQPVFDCHSGEPVGAEALIRWNHSEQGWIPPGIFIPFAEKTGLIIDVGHFQFETALDWFESSQSLLPEGFRLALNLSPTQIENTAFIGWLASRLADSTLQLDQLELEITETALLADTPEIRENLSALTKMGVCITLDDFGTGQSSLSLLKRFPIGRLKIDRSFVSGLPNESDDAAIVGAVLSLAASLEIPVVAEGVEREEQRQFLTSRLCNDMQGFLLAKPMPGEQLIDFLSSAVNARSNRLGTTR